MVAAFGLNTLHKAPRNPDLVRWYSYVNQHVKYVVTISYAVQIAYVDASLGALFFKTKSHTIAPRKSYILAELCRNSDSEQIPIHFTINLLRMWEIGRLEI